MHTNGHRQACQDPTGAISTYFKNLLLSIGRNPKGKEERRGLEAEKRRYWQTLGKHPQVTYDAGRVLWTEYSVWSPDHRRGTPSVRLHTVSRSLVSQRGWRSWEWTRWESPSLLVWLSLCLWHPCPQVLKLHFLPCSSQGHGPLLPCSGLTYATPPRFRNHTKCSHY